MTIESKPVDELGNSFPVYGDKLIQEYRQDAMSYIQSDQYDGLEYYGKYTNISNAENEADVAITLTSSNISYHIHYNFTDANSGT